MSDTRCDLFGHQFSLCKEGGKSYMKCEYCPAVRHTTADDLQRDNERIHMRTPRLTETPKISPEELAQLQEYFKRQTL